ncbi:unnamed protein product [Cylicocyclus nassatus]|uniref:Uncharacterized protein n=1 Tax=Cylicocyclus nassatus TaxID=53992 RepID=A0AA36GM49_CYLNA|nr:unnamed protein product [Cylicocyclus nassatus]
MVSNFISVLFCATSVALVTSQSAPSGPGQCPGGPSLNIQCDPKRPWPQCPPQSYCYATGSVDVGPHYCCPVWSTYGASYRPAAPFYDYVPPMPEDWPLNIKASANWPTSIISRNAMAKLKISFNNEDADENENVQKFSNVNLRR